MADLAGYTPLPPDAQLDKSPDGYMALPSDAKLDNSRQQTLLDQASTEGIGSAIQSIPQRVGDWWNDTGNASHVVTADGRRLLKWTPEGMQAVKDQGGSIRDTLMSNPLTGMAPGEGLMRSPISLESHAPVTPAISARQSGYVVPPQMAGEGGLVSNILSALGGKTKLQQAASVKNAEVSSRLGAQAIGLPPDAPLTEQAFKDVRANAGNAYDAISNSGVPIKQDMGFVSDLLNTHKDLEQAAAEFPDLMKNDEVTKIQNALGTGKDISPGAAVQLIRKLRGDSGSNIKNWDDPVKQQLGYYQKDAANAVESLIERNLAASGRPDLIPDFRNARQTIAKSYDLEAATNTATGEVDAQKLAKLYAKGRPLTGDLKSIAETAAAFPKAMQMPSKFGGEEKHSILGLFGAGELAAHTNPLVGVAAMLSRPAARAYLLSQMSQPGLGSFSPAIGSASPALRAGSLSASQGLLGAPGRPNAGLLGAY